MYKSGSFYYASITIVERNVQGTGWHPAYDNFDIVGLTSTSSGRIFAFYFHPSGILTEA